MASLLQNRRVIFLLSFFLVLSTLVVYWQVKDHQFILYDDPIYVYENPHVQTGLTGRNIVWAFTSSHANNWHPLTWVSHMVDVQLFGLRPGGHHLVNVLFHIANTVLLFLILHRMTHALWRSAFVAALFALHPLHVESVAWVSERKDVLSTFFWMLTLGAYAFYVEKPGLKRYLITLAFFALGLMAKPMLVTLPFVLLLLDYWPLGRFKAEGKRHLSAKERKKQDKKKIRKSQPTWKDELLSQGGLVWHLVKEKIPFLIFSAASSLVTLYSQKEIIAQLKEMTIGDRVANALVSYVLYIWKTIYPTSLAVFYPYSSNLPAWEIFTAVLLLSSATFMVIRWMRRYPYLAMGWLWYVGTLIPVIGIIQTGSQAMADRYTYLPIIGIFIAATWTVANLAEKWRHQQIAAAISAGVLLSILSAVSFLQVQHWRNNITLFQHALDVTPENELAHNNIGVAFEDQGKIDEAVSHYREAIRIDPNRSTSNYNMGNALYKKGRIEEAAHYYNAAIKINPGHAGAQSRLGIILASQGKMDEAILHFVYAIRSNPDSLSANLNLGDALVSSGKPDDALAYYYKALRLDPNSAAVHYTVGTILASYGKIDEAVAHFREAIRSQPEYAKAHNNLGSALLIQGKIDEAIMHFQEALRLQPEYAVARNNLADALATARKFR